MAFVYEINGQRVEFEKEPTERDIDEAARQLGPASAPSAKATTLPSAQRVLGGTESSAAKVASRASIADTALNAVTGTWDLAARALATPYYYATGPKGQTVGQAWEQAAQAVEEGARRDPLIPRPDLVGRTLGIANTQQYATAPQRQLAEAAAPVIHTAAVAPLSRATGLPEGAAADLLAIASIPLAGPTGRAIKAIPDAVAATPQFAKGVVGQASGKGTKPGERATYAGQYESARQPAGTTYHRPEDLQAWREGVIDTRELNNRAIPYTPEQANALKQTGGMVPYEGQIAQAAGEAFVEPYTKLSGYVPDLLLGGAGYLLGGPLGAGVAPALNIIRRGSQAVNAAREVGAMRQLGDLRFTPLFPEELAAIQKNQPNPSVITPAAGPVRPPVTPAEAQPSPVTTQPVNPDVPLLTYNPSPSVLYGSETGIVGKTPQEVVTADLAQRYAPQPVVTATPEAQPAPAVTAPSTKALTVSETAGKTAEQLAADQKILDFINARRGIVANDPAANRQNFANKVSETRQQLEFAREQNKQMFGDRAKAMNERAGEGSMTPSQKDQITDATAVRYMINQTTQTAVKQQGKKVSYSEPQLNELATQAGITLDWKTAPDISNMGVGEARKAINKWMFDSIDAQSPELGLKTRKESLRAQERRAERESAGQPEATLSAEETEALRKRQEKLLGKQTQAEPKQQYANAAEMRKDLYGKMPNDELEALVNKTFPSVNTLKEKMSKSKGEQNAAMDEALRQRLEALKQQGKYRGPKDASQMMISPDDMTPSQQAFKQQEMMDTMSGKPTYGEYFDAQGNKIVYQERYPNMPDFVKNKAADRDVPIVRKFDPEGNRIPMGEDWSASDPAPVSVAVKKRLSKEPYDLYWENDGEIIRERGNLNKPFKHDPTVTIKRVEQTQNPVGGDDAIVMQAYGKTRRGEEVIITEYGDGAMKGTYTDAKGKQRHRIY